MEAVATRSPRTFAVTGASGLVGAALCSELQKRGHNVVRLVRSVEEASTPNTIFWNIQKDELDRDALMQAAPDVVVHLAGENVFALRWTKEKKRKIKESRVRGTRLLSKALAELPTKPSVLLSASASGIYGDRADNRITESSELGDGFLSDVCKAWESATRPTEDAGIRTVHMRFGLALARESLFLRALTPIYKMGLGGPIGKGKRYLPWITVDDIVGGILHLVDSDLSGPVNFAAPNAVTGKAFGGALGRELHRPSVIPVPPLALSMLGGQMAREIALTSSRLYPERLLNDGYVFRHPTIEDALASIYK